MATELTTQQTFEENIKERLRRDIGDLLPDSVLSDLVTKAVNSLFFEPRKNRSQWGTEIYEKSWFLQEVEKLMKERIQEEVKTFFTENRNEVLTKFTEAIKEELPRLLAGFVLDTFTGASNQIQLDLQNRIQGHIVRELSS